MDDTSMPQLDLVEVLGTLREEIGRAEKEALGEDLQFTFSAVRIELSVAIERSATAKAGVKFWVVEAGGEAALKNVATHRVAFDLNLTSAATGESPRVSDRPLEYEP
jgi:Trypsin-co-occurring domain 2